VTLTAAGPEVRTGAGLGRAERPAGLLEVLEIHGGEALPGHPAADLLAEVRERAARLDVVAGEAIALTLPQGTGWVIGYLTLLAAGASPLLVAPEAPAAEAERLLKLRGGRRRLTAGAKWDDEPVLHGAGPGEPIARAVLIPTSGSTGTPNLVARDERSLVAEGLRYRHGVDLRVGDAVLMAVPLCHAFGLGALYGAWCAGTIAHPVSPTALNAVRKELTSDGELAGGAEVMFLVPTLARLLATRVARGARPARLRLVMAGAGPVDDKLEESFRAVFRVGVARNYGSTELGASFAGPPGLPARAIGNPLPGVRFRLVDDVDKINSAEEVGPGEPGADDVATGRLEIRFDGDGPVPGVPDGWHDTGDIATREGNGVRIIGRRGRAIRRGGRWVSPLEVEDVVRQVDGVRDVLVKRQGGDRIGEDRILALVAVDPDGPDQDALRAAAERELAPYKVPDEFRLRDSLRRTFSGKVLADQQFRLAPGAMAAARAYKAAELLFALHELGALEPLANGAPADDLAARLGCDSDALEWLLRVATDLGVISTDPDAPPVDADELLGFVRLEELLSRTLVTREELASVARTGLQARSFETSRLGQLPRRYQSAMHGAVAVARTRLGLRLSRPARGAHVVEVTAGPGHYLSAALERDPSATGELLQLGRLACEPARSLRLAAEDGRVTFAKRLPEGGADLCVVANGIHGPGLGADLAGLLATLRPGGKLLVDDVFMPGHERGPGAELGLDWITHGGTRWPSVDDLAAGVAQLGGDVVRRMPLRESPCSLVLVSRNEGAEKL